MKVGTDAVLLGCLCKAHEPLHALDIGTGSGIIALQLAQRFPNCLIDAIEIEQTAATQASSNFQHSPWSDRLQLLHADVRNWDSTRSYDLIVSNPPFYPDTFPMHDNLRRQAREQETLSYQELAYNMARLLNQQGNCWCILPSNYENMWLDALAVAGLYAFSITYIRGAAHKAANRLVVGASSRSLEKTKNELSIRTAEGHYTAEYLKLTSDFYLFA